MEEKRFELSDEMLRRSELFAGITEEEIQKALHCIGAERVRKEKGGYLLRAGKITTRMGILISGSAFIIQEDVWGYRSIVVHLQGGDTYAESFALSDGVPTNISVVAETDCEALVFPVERVMTMCGANCPFHRRMMENLVSILARKLLGLNNKITHLSRRTTRGKLLSYLSAESHRQGKLTFTIPFDRQELADYLCVDRAAMSSVLSELKREGILTFEKSRFTLNPDVPDEPN